MAQTRFAVAWEEHESQICGGLSSFQQNGDFVDMTLAADGHYVKVHQVVLALASPYIKGIISEINCSHPVIFLNRVSYGTLSYLLEYIYTGEVLVGVEHLNDIIEAAKELHIRGLENMNVVTAKDDEKKESNGDEEEICYFEMKNDDNSIEAIENSTNSQEDSEVNMSQAEEWADEPMGGSESSNTVLLADSAENNKANPNIVCRARHVDSRIKSNIMQYTISNQGSLQMILNRYIYYLKHTNRDNSRQWRCVDYVNKIKCPAIVFTKDDFVTQRISAHTHPFHDRRIIKKARANAIFSAIDAAYLNDKNKVQNKSDDDMSSVK